MNWNGFFINQSGRLRSGWRLAVFLLAFIFVGGVFSGVAQLILAKLNTTDGINFSVFISVNNFFLLLAAVLLGWLCGKLLEDLPFRALGAWFTKGWLKDLLLGFGGGAATLLVAVLIASAFGGLRFNLNRAQGETAIVQSLLVSLLVFIIGAAWEEAFFRGYLLQTFSRAKLAWLGIALTATYFAVAHSRNDNADYLSTFNTALAGVWFGIAYLKTRTLWFPFGLHLFWNWFQGAVFGIEVSGITALTNAPLLVETDAGPTWLTGANYGIEGGIACTAAVLISMAVIWFAPILKPTEEMLVLTNEENERESFST